MTKTNHYIGVNGMEMWRNNRGQFHCDDGPAIIYESGLQCWYKEDKMHRVDGPAFMHPNGVDAWYIDDCIYRTPKQFQEAAKLSDEDMAFILLKYNFK